MPNPATPTVVPLPPTIPAEADSLLDSLRDAAAPKPSPTAADLRRNAEDAVIETVIVAVHGIGDQYRFATIQSVAHRVAQYFGPPVGIPLGNFHAPDKATRALPFKGQPKLGLAEVYWADIPREANRNKDTIEETKAWAETMVQRVRAMDLNRPVRLAGDSQNETSVDYQKTSAVVAGMIDFIGTLENLCFLAEKAGLMKFDLRELLDEYLGDVQIVAEFEDYRGKILEAFRKTMADLNRRHPKLKSIHIVAHSEGTVVTFRGLLDALLAQGGNGDEWIEKVKSLMTIGSPIDKHVVMWPELWQDFKTPPVGWKMPEAIRWWNYYDFGDPVGFELDTARQWLIHYGWVKAKPAAKHDGSRVPEEEGQDFFDFRETQDIGFTRYPFPGKAHNDYWDDNDVFDHFLAVGMKLERPARTPPVKQPPDPPKTDPRWKVVSWVLPYVLAVILLFAGTYLVYKNVGEVIASPESNRQLALSVLGLTALLAGVTVVSRIPRLVPLGWWYLLPSGLFVAGASLYWWLVGDGNVPPGQNAADKLGWALWAEPGDPSRRRMILVCLAVGLVSAQFSKWKPKWGMWPLMVTTGGTTALVVWRLLGRFTVGKAGEDPKLWPVILSVLAFLYLWWLAAQLFDLVFIWHRYICGNIANEKVKQLDPVLALAKQETRDGLRRLQSHTTRR